MIAKVSSKHQVTIPAPIAAAFGLKKGDVLDIKQNGHQIVMIPKEIIYEEKYPQEDLQAVEAVLARDLPRKEIRFPSGAALVKHLRKRIKKS